MDEINLLVGFISGAIAGGFIMHERGYMQGMLKSLRKQDHVDILANELREVKESISDIKMEQEVLDLMVKEIKNK